jgi:hypothetical protein
MNKLMKADSLVNKLSNLRNFSSFKQYPVGGLYAERIIDKEKK